MADGENVIYQLEKTAEFLQKYGFGGFEAIRCAVTLLKEQENLEERHKILVESYDDLLAELKERTKKHECNDDYCEL